MNLFDAIPSGFFNCLASGSNQNIYSDCLQLIYYEYDREISYRIPRKRIRDTLSIYFMESHKELTGEEFDGDKSAYDMASSVIRKFLSKEIGWLEEEINDTTYEKQILMTENSIALAEMLMQLEKPEKEEFSSYIFNIYNTLQNQDQWIENPYINGVKNIHKNARSLSKALKKLSTFIRKIIEKMVQEKTLESITENILEYCEGNFIREYARLTKQQNIHIYRIYIKSRLDEMSTDTTVFNRIVEECAKEENLSIDQAEDMVLDMLQNTKRFLVEDYDKIMRDIKHKINIYLQVAVGRARFIRNKEKDARGNIEKIMQYLMEELSELPMKEELPDEMNKLFMFDTHQFIDEGSIRFPRKNQMIREPIISEFEEMTEDDINRAKEAQKKEAFNPYCRELMKSYLEHRMGSGRTLVSSELPMNNKRELLANLSAIAYAQENGYSVEVLDGYYEMNNMLMREFKITKEDE